MNARPYVYIVLVFGITGILLLPAMWGGVAKKEASTPISDTEQGTASPKLLPEEKSGDEVARLQAELDEANLQVAKLRERLEGLENDEINEVVFEWLNELRSKASTGPQRTEAEHRERFETIYRRAERHNFEEGFLGGLGDALNFMFQLARMGETGEQLVLESINNIEVDPDVRTEMIEFLAYMPSANALHALLNPPADLVEQHGLSVENYLSGIAQVVAALPPEVITPHADQLRSLIQAGVAQNDSDAYKMATVMAFQMDDPYAHQVLRQPAAFNDHIRSVLRIAAWTGTPEALLFVEEIQQVHHDPEVREIALKLMEEW